MCNIIPPMLRGDADGAIKAVEKTAIQVSDAVNDVANKTQEILK